MITKLKQYLGEVLGIDVDIKKDEEVQNKLPYALSPRYSVYVAEIFGQRIHFAVDSETTTPSGYEKEESLLKRLAGTAVAIVTETVTPVDVHRMIQKRIDFIVPGKRMFMPSLLTDIGGRYAVEGEMPDVIPPLAQLVILFYLQKGNLNGLDAKAIAEKFNATYLTASRSLKWIGQKISPLKEDGRKLLLNLPANNELLALAKPFLRTPIVKIIRTDDSISGIDGVFAGESALEEYSMIAAVGQCKAVGKDVKVSICQDSGGINCIEKWMYDPSILAEDGICDKLSLILSMADNPDERIHKEIVKLKETVI